jgi:hypothetical protein
LAVRLLICFAWRLGVMAVNYFLVSLGVSAVQLLLIFLAPWRHGG